MAFTFNGINSAGILIDNKVRHSILPPVRSRLLQVPGRAGAYDFGADLGPRVIEVEVTVVGRSQTDLRARMRQIAAWLLQADLKPLTFADEPGMTYYARLDGSTDLDEIVSVGRGTITFLCPDPFAYGAPKSQEVTGDPEVVNSGTQPTFPKITAIFEGAAPYFRVAIGTRAILLNRSFEAGDVVVMDHDRNLVTVNGSRAMPSLDLASEFFPLTPGANSIVVEPPDAAVITMEWTERWL